MEGGETGERYPVIGSKKRRQEAINRILLLLLLLLLVAAQTVKFNETTNRQRDRQRDRHVSKQREVCCLPLLLG